MVKAAGPVIYLDYNATAPLRPEARTAMLAALDEAGNASSVHTPGRAARARLEAARATLRTCVNAPRAEVIFTSGATEANALALQGLPVKSRLIAATEHDSVRQNAADALLIPVDADGVVQLDALAVLLKAAPAPVLASVMWANNETGVLQPVHEITRLVRAAGGYVHTDAVQAFGRVPVDMADIDLLSLSAHKLGGPMGTGALLVRPGLSLGPLYRGGGQEKGLRPGTENVAAIAGFASAADRAAKLDDVQKWQRWQDDLIHSVSDQALIVAGAAQKIGNTVCLIHPRLTADLQLMKLDLAGINVSSGSACSSGRVTGSHVLAAMGYDEKAQKSAIRVSFGWATHESDLAEFAAQYLAM